MEITLVVAAFSAAAWYHAVFVSSIISPLTMNVRRILVRGSMPPCRLRRRNLENLTTKWCILKYI